MLGLKKQPTIDLVLDQLKEVRTALDELTFEIRQMNEVLEKTEPEEEPLNIPKPL